MLVLTNDKRLVTGNLMVDKRLPHVIYLLQNGLPTVEIALKQNLKQHVTHNSHIHSI